MNVRIRKLVPCVLAAVLAAALLITPVSGQLTNGSFETGDFTGWTTGGATLSVGQSAVYTSGGIQWTITPAASNMAVLRPTGSLNFTTTAAALNLSNASKTYFTSVFSNPTNFAYVYQSVYLNPGDTLTMGWNYLATDYAPFNDASFTTFVNLDDPTTLGKINGGAAQINILGATVTGGNYNTGNYGSTGWQTATYQATNAGHYQLGAAVFNLGDTINSPYLFFDVVGGTTLKNGTPFNPVAPASNPPPPPTPTAIDTTNGDISASVFSLTSGPATASPVQFSGGTLQMSGNTTLTAPIAIDAANAYVDNNNGSGGFTGDVSGAGSLNLSGGGTFSLSGNNSYLGGTTVNGTTLSVQSDSALGTGALAMTNATLSGSQTLSNAIGITGSNTVAVSSGTMTLNGVISGGGSLSKTGAGTLSLSGTNTYSGATSVQGGTLTLGGSLASSAIDIASGATLNDVNGGLSSSATFSNAGTVNLGADDTVATVTNSGTINGPGKLNASTYALNGGSIVNANLGAGALTSNSAVLLNGTSDASAVNVQTGTLTLGGADLLADDANVTIGTTGTLAFGGGETIGQINGSGLISLGANTLGVSSGNYAGVISGSGGLTKTGSGLLTLSGANLYTGNTTIQNGTLTLDGSLASNAVGVSSGATLNNLHGGFASTSTLTNAGTINLGDDDTVAAFINSGTINGPGKLNASTYALNGGSIVNANLGAGTLTSNGTVLLNGTSDASAVNVQTGTLTLGGADRLADDANVTVGTTGTLALGGAEKIGQINGGGTVALGANAFTVSSGTFDGTITGSGSLTKLGAGVLTLSGVHSFTGPTHVQAGTLMLGGSLASSATDVSSGATLNNLHGGFASTSTLTNAGTINLGDDDTVTTFINSGTINGPGKLNASTYALNGGSIVNASLGAGTLTSNGTVQLNGTSDATVVTIQSGTLSLGAAERFSNAANVTVQNGAGLNLGGDETIGQINGAGSVSLNTYQLSVSSGNFSGGMSGSGGLTKTGPGALTLSGVNTYTGSTLVQGGKLDLDGSLASRNVAISSSATLNDQHGGLAPDAVVNNAGQLNLGADDTIAHLINSGTINGPGKLNASTYALNGGSIVNANLGAGTLTSNGAVLLNGTSDASNVFVQSGTLQLGSSERLSSLATVTVNSDATLQMNGDQHLANFISSGHLIGRSGDTLTAALYDLRDGAVIDADIGHGTVTSNGMVLLNGKSAGEIIKVQSGALTLGGPDRLADYAWVDVQRSSQLVLANGNDTIRLLTGEGNVELRNGSILTVLEGSYSGTASSTGALLKDQSTTLTLAGTNTYQAGTTVRQGELVVSNSGQLTSEVKVERNGLFRIDGLVHGGVNIDAGGQLMGGGVIANDAVNRGTTRPSASGLKIMGTYTEAGTLSLALNGSAGPGGNSQLMVGGPMQINPGSTLAISKPTNSTFEPSRGESISVIKASGGITGTFSTLDRSAFSTEVLFDYGTGRVVGTGLNEGAPLADLGGKTANGRALMGALANNAVTADSKGAKSFFDTRKSSGSLFMAMLQAPSMSDALDSLSPEPYAGLADYALYSTHNYARQSTHAPVLSATECWRVSGGYASLRTGTRSSANNADYDLASGGGTVAVERQLGGRTLVGGFYAKDSGAVKAHRLDYDVTGHTGGLHVSVLPAQGSRLGAEAGASYARYNFEGARAGLFGRVNGQTRGTAHEIWAKAELTVLRAKNHALGLYSGGYYTRARIDGFAEKAATGGFSVGESASTRLAGELGVNATAQVMRKLGLSLRTGLDHNFKSGERAVSATLADGGVALPVTAAGFDRDTLTVGAGVNYAANRMLSLSLSYDAGIDKRADLARAFGARVQLKF